MLPPPYGQILKNAVLLCNTANFDLALETLKFPENSVLGFCTDFAPGKIQRAVDFYVKNLCRAPKGPQAERFFSKNQAPKYLCASRDPFV